MNIRYRLDNIFSQHAERGINSHGVNFYSSVISGTLYLIFE